MSDRTGRYWDDFRVGDAIDTASRTISDQDIAAFATLSGDHNPLHTDPAYARSVGFPGLIAHGVLVLSLTTGLIAALNLLDGTAIGFLELQWRFRGAVLSGDTIVARLTVTELRETKRADRGVLLRDVSVANQRGEVVQAGSQTILVRRRLDPAEAGGK